MPKARSETGQMDMVQHTAVGLDTQISLAQNPPSAAKSLAKPLDFRKKMSDNIAYALLVYTGLQIFVTMGALRAEGGSLLPYLALIILVVAIIPSCRRFERRWNRLSDAQAADPSLRSYFRHDLIVLWLLAVGLPFAITGVFRLLAMALT